MSGGQVIHHVYLGLLCLGKNDFDAIENFRTDAFFKRSLAVQVVPSSPTLRQRMNAHAENWFDLATQLNTALLSSRINGQPIDFGHLPCGYTPLDIDTFAMDNSGTRKELVGRTYAGVDGYCLELALRPSTQHSANESEYNLERVLPMAASLVDTPLLVRADSGFCSLKLMQAITAQAHECKHAMAFIIKRNPRTTPVEAIAAQQCADASVTWCLEREGKRFCLWRDLQNSVDLPNFLRSEAKKDAGTAQKAGRSGY